MAQDEETGNDWDSEERNPCQYDEERLVTLFSRKIKLKTPCRHG
jgi:hypothetical protein